MTVMMSLREIGLSRDLRSLKHPTLGEARSPSRGADSLDMKIVLHANSSFVFNILREPVTSEFGA